MSGKNSWTSLTAGKTVAGAAEEEAAAREALSAAKTRAKKATAEEALEAATADLEMVEEARQRSADGGEFIRSDLGWCPSLGRCSAPGDTCAVFGGVSAGKRKQCCRWSLEMLLVVLLLL